MTHETDNEPIVITDVMTDLCGRLGIEPRLVGKLIILPTEIIAKVFLLNANGDKYLDELDEAAIEMRIFEVKT